MLFDDAWGEFNRWMGSVKEGMGAAARKRHFWGLVEGSRHIGSGEGELLKGGIGRLISRLARNANGKRRAFLGRRSHLNRAPLGLHNLAHNVQAQPHTTRIPR